MGENPRTTTARDNDDSDLIEGMIPSGDAQVGSSGGRLQTDVGSQDDLKGSIDNPEDRTRPEKADDIANDQSYASDRR